MNFLVIGAHPDDPDLMFGGCAVQLLRKGHRVKFVSVTGGGAGHQTMTRDALCARRFQEAQASAKRAGLTEYTILNNPDGHLENRVSIREDLTRIIREFKADVVITHRLCDYHPDHRNTSQMVLDTAYLVRVPAFCPDAKVPDKMPIYIHSMDFFTDPRPLRIDAAVKIDNEVPDVIDMFKCHVSQFFEWLPWIDLDMPDFDASNMTEEEKNAFIYKHWMVNYRKAAMLAGMPEGTHAQLFEISPYGRTITSEQLYRILND